MKTFLLSIFVLGSALLARPGYAQQYLEVDASSYDEPVFLTFFDGLMVEGNAENWILAVKRVGHSSNSGTSGDANFGVFNTEITDFDGVTSCDYGDLVVDEIIPFPGPPGSGEFSGNPVLTDWYIYDIFTHTLASKGLVYIVTNTYFCFKYQILEYRSGVYQVVTQVL